MLNTVEQRFHDVTKDNPIQICLVAITYLSSMCLYTLPSALSTTIRRSMSVSRQSLQLFWKPGLILCAGYLCFYYALRYENVPQVVPLTNIEPFFVFIFAYIFLRELEKITYKLIIETLIIVTGVSLITIFWREINAHSCKVC